MVGGVTAVRRRMADSEEEYKPQLSKGRRKGRKATVKRMRGARKAKRKRTQANAASGAPAVTQGEPDYKKQKFLEHLRTLESLTKGPAMPPGVPTGPVAVTPVGVKPDLTLDMPEFTLPDTPVECSLNFDLPPITLPEALSFLPPTSPLSPAVSPMVSQFEFDRTMAMIGEQTKPMAVSPQKKKNMKDTKALEFDIEPLPLVPNSENDQDTDDDLADDKSDVPDLQNSGASNPPSSDETYAKHDIQYDRAIKTLNAWTNSGLYGIDNSVVESVVSSAVKGSLSPPTELRALCKVCSQTAPAHT